MTAGVVEAVEAIARDLGARFDASEVLWDRANLVLRLGSDLVARVSTVTAAHRGAAAEGAMARSVRVARHLAAAGVVAPRAADAIDPGPHSCGAGFVTFWSHVDHDATRPVDAALAGVRLRALHDALSSLPHDEFPRLMPLAELPAMIEALIASGDVPSDEGRALSSRLAASMREIDALALPETILHGDASPGNLLHTPSGPIWSDFEEACLGPRELDLACVVATGRAFDLPSRALRDAVLAAYGPTDEEALRPFIEARVIQALVWDAAISTGDARAREVASARRMAWLEAARL